MADYVTFVRSSLNDEHLIAEHLIPEEIQAMELGDALILACRLAYERRGRRMSQESNRFNAQQRDGLEARIAALEVAARRLLAAIPYHEELADYVEYDVALDALVRELDR